MRAGEQPLPIDVDDTGAYGAELPQESADIHQLAMVARRKRLLVSDKQQLWNEVVRVRDGGQKKFDQHLHVSSCQLTADVYSLHIPDTNCHVAEAGNVYMHFTCLAG